MTKPTHFSAALLTGLLVLGGTACGGGSKHSSTTTTTASTPTTTQPTSGKTATTKTAPTTPKPSSPPKSNQTPLSQTPAKTLTFTGSGVKDIGKPDPLRIPKDSTIQWTNTGAIFQIIPASVKVQSPVNSKAHSGTATIKKGAYYVFLINAIGNWTVKIIPSG
jgi:hypothetical protein